MHKDLSEQGRGLVEADARELVRTLILNGESLAIAREAFINEFDLEATEIAAASA